MDRAEEILDFRLGGEDGFREVRFRWDEGFDRETRARFREDYEQAAVGELGTPEVLDYAVRHQRIVERFGRFPHRNEILDRVSMPEEEAFLGERDYPFYPTLLEAGRSVRWRSNGRRCRR